MIAWCARTPVTRCRYGHRALVVRGIANVALRGDAQIALKDILFGQRTEGLPVISQTPILIVVVFEI
ncbi:MAG: hypothetical protein M3305_08420 [Actinomycetota bacterium]|nr:hypothetical protein [Actinomycetota bacterium]